MKPALFGSNALRQSLAGLSVASSLVAPVALAAPTTPTTDFSDNGDGTVTHYITGLTWKRCAEGQTWSGSTCSGTAKTYSWTQANALGSGDWRLPTVAELVTIVERDNFKPAINATIFPKVQEESASFWSASTYAADVSQAWYVNFGPGNSYSFSKSSDPLQVRLVRGGRTRDSFGGTTPTADFIDNGDGTVTHKQTSLTWKRCTEGLRWNGSECTGTVQTYVWNAANALGGDGWRLPTINELQTLVEYAVAEPGPTINTTIFPDMAGSISEGNFWSASAFAGGQGNAWDINFDNGADRNANREDGSIVRLVRGRQSTEYHSGSDCLFFWGERNYPQYFSPSGGKSLTFSEYYYRAYAGDVYLGTSKADNHLYYILGDGVMHDAGLASQWYVRTGCQQ